MVAAPAVLQLTGRANWWFPPWLERAVPGFLAEVGPGKAADSAPRPAPHRINDHSIHLSKEGTS